MPSAVDHKQLFTFPEVSGRGVGLWRSKTGGQVPPKRLQIASRRWPRVDVAKPTVELKAKDDGGGGREGGRGGGRRQKPLALQAEVVWDEKARQLAEIDQLAARDPKNAHRAKCMQALRHVRCIEIEGFGDPTGTRESVLIEFRPMPHLEFLLRNTILKLSDWNHTVVCGNKNFAMISRMCRQIDFYASGTINLVKLDIDNLTPSGYSQLLMTKHFWDNLSGEKILLYQEDTILFHGRIESFMKYDYIGAPWPPHQDDNAYGVGNGGFSLRSKSKLIKCLEEVPVSSLKLGKWTVDYMNNTNSTFVPEDVFFSKAMIDRGIGRVACREVAMSFSQETQKSWLPMGGHQYWLAQHGRIFAGGDLRIVGVYSPYAFTIGGGERYLSYVIRTLIKIGCSRIYFYNETAPVVFGRTLEHFLGNNDATKVVQKSVRELQTTYRMYDIFIEMGNSQKPHLLLNRRLGKTTVYHCQFPFDYASATRIPLPNVDHIVVNSEFTQKYYKKGMAAEDQSKLVIRYPPCFDRLGDVESNKIRNAFVMVGRIHRPYADAHNKCQLDVVKVFSSLANTDYAFELYIIGSIIDKEYYELLKQYEVEGKIHILGNCTEEAKNKVIDRCQYHIHATGLHATQPWGYEHFGISTIECLNRGCIPICMDGGYFPYYIRHEVNGYLFSNSLELSCIVENILNSKKPLVNSAQAASLNKALIKKFSNQSFARGLAGLFYAIKP